MLVNSPHVTRSPMDFVLYRSAVWLIYLSTRPRLQFKFYRIGREDLTVSLLTGSHRTKREAAINDLFLGWDQCLQPHVVVHNKFSCSSLVEVAGVRPSRRYSPRPHGISVSVSRSSRLKELGLINLTKMAARLYWDATGSGISREGVGLQARSCHRIGFVS